MFRPTALFNAASRVAAVRAAPTMTRFYAAGAGVSVEERIMDVLKGFDKVEQNKVRGGHLENRYIQRQQD